MRSRISAIVIGASVLALSLAAVAMAATIIGTNAGETLVGTNHHDTIKAKGGNDKVRARGGNDFVNAGSGNDKVNGGSGTDELQGRNGNDTQLGGDGADLLRGGAGNDVQNGSSGPDVVFSGPGVDISRGGPGNDEIWGLIRSDVNTSGGPDMTGDTLIGGRGDDTIHARDGEADRINCGPGTDTAILDKEDVIVDATAGNPKGSCEKVPHRRDPKPKRPDRADHLEALSGSQERIEPGGPQGPPVRFLARLPGRVVESPHGIRHRPIPALVHQRKPARRAVMDSSRSTPPPASSSARSRC